VWQAGFRPFFVPLATRLASNTEHNLEGVLWCYPRHAFFEPLPNSGKSWFPYAETMD
jgi:hypothetical protein